MMYKIFLILLLNPLVSIAQISLTIEICDLRNNSGQILLELNNENEVKIMGISEKIADNKCVVNIENLEPGKYAFKYFHDENNNDKLDLNWIGIPKEGYGFSNNAKGTFGPPAFKKMIFDLEGVKKMKCIPDYIMN